MHLSVLLPFLRVKVGKRSEGSTLDPLQFVMDLSCFMT